MNTNVGMLLGDGGEVRRFGGKLLVGRKDEEKEEEKKWRKRSD